MNPSSPPLGPQSERPTCPDCRPWQHPHAEGCKHKPRDLMAALEESLSERREPQALNPEGEGGA